MKCMDALDAMMTADLRPTAAGGELADHLLTCSRCQAIAAQLRGETAALASIASAVPLTVTSSAMRTSARLLQGAGLALAALLVAVLLPGLVTERFADATLGERRHEAPRSSDGSAQRPLAVGEAPRPGRFAPALDAPKPQTGAGSSASRPTAAADDTRSMRSRSAERARRADLGVPVPAPLPVEAVAILPMVVALDDVAEGRDAAPADSSRRKPVLLPQSNPHVTVFWVY